MRYFTWSPAKKADINLKSQSILCQFMNINMYLRSARTFPKAPEHIHGINRVNYFVVASRVRTHLYNIDEHFVA